MPTFKDIFYWNDWDDLGQFEMYMNCEVLRDVGDDIKDGDEFEVIYFDTKNLELHFHKTQDSSEPIIKKFILV